MTGLVEKIVILSGTLTAARMHHALGGALALAWCTAQARGTIDIDVNVFVGPESAPRVLNCLPPGVRWQRRDADVLAGDGQVRVWWERVPLDLFLNTTPYHEQLLERVSWEPFEGHRLPFLSCLDLAVFKAFFNRLKDWADLEAMREAGTLDEDAVRDVLSTYLGEDDERLRMLERLREKRPGGLLF